jgi:hypothetical protein
MSDSQAPGLEPSGPPDVTPSSASGTRLSEEQVVALAKMLDAGCYSTREMSHAIGCSQSTVVRAMKGHTRVEAELRRLRERSLAAERQRRKRIRGREQVEALHRLREATGIAGPRGAQVWELHEGHGPVSAAGQDLRLAERTARRASSTGYEAFLDRRDLDRYTAQLREAQGLDGTTGGLVLQVGNRRVTAYPLDGPREVARAREQIIAYGGNPDDPDGTCYLPEPTPE